jgi:hypothetical protein
MHSLLGYDDSTHFSLNRAQAFSLVKRLYKESGKRLKMGLLTLTLNQTASRYDDSYTVVRYAQKRN